jgi:hypothetical protein
MKAKGLIWLARTEDINPTKQKPETRDHQENRLNIEHEHEKKL